MMYLAPGYWLAPDLTKSFSLGFIVDVYSVVVWMLGSWGVFKKEEANIGYRYQMNT